MERRRRRRPRDRRARPRRRDEIYDDDNDDYDDNDDDDEEVVRMVVPNRIHEPSVFVSFYPTHFCWVIVIVTPRLASAGTEDRRGAHERVGSG